VSLSREAALRILDRSDLVCGPDEVAAAVTRMAGEITARLGSRMPIVLAVMGGGVVFCGQLLPQLGFPLDFDYIHATRYRGATSGGSIEWRVRPTQDVRGRTVLVLDDILDEGHTLAAIREALLEAGAAEVFSAVFCEKQLAQDKPVRADFVGVHVPDRYVFGFGMDVHGAWRNLPAIHAVNQED
jgi:hypoxanthine phosphoribosyltransferase